MLEAFFVLMILSCFCMLFYIAICNENKQIKWFLIFGFLLILSSAGLVWEIHQRNEELKRDGFDVYTLRLYYLGGSQDIKDFVTYTDDYPYIYSYKGEYTLKGVFKPEEGVVRFQVLSKRNISYESYEDN